MKNLDDALLYGTRRWEFDLSDDALRAADTSEDWDVEGIAAPYNRVTPITNDFSEELVPRCFRQSIDRAHARKPRTREGKVIEAGIPLYMNHGHDDAPIGRSVEFIETEDALVGRWRFADTEEARAAQGLMRDGVVTGLSVGFQATRDGNEVIVGDDGVTLVRRRKARLLEVSAVGIPAYEDAGVTVVRAGLISPPRPRRKALEQWLEARRAVR